MSIPTANASYAVSSGPTKSGQIVANNITGPLARMIAGTAAVVLDGSLTAFNVNWIDGTETLAWTPTVVFASRIPGAATDALSTITVTGVSVIDTTKFTVQISAAGTNGHNLKLSFLAF